MVAIGIGPLFTDFVFFSHFRESKWCFIVYLQRFILCLFIFFASHENSHCHIFMPVYKPTRVLAHQITEVSMYKPRAC